jgi:hypothetical protein
MLKEQEVAERINMSVHWLRRKRWAGGGIPYLKMAEGGAERYRAEDVELFLSSKMKRSTSDQG